HRASPLRHPSPHRHPAPARRRRLHQTGRRRTPAAHRPSPQRHPLRGARHVAALRGRRERGEKREGPPLRLPLRSRRTSRLLRRSGLLPLIQITSTSLYSPNTRRIASQISPTVASLSTASTIAGSRLSPLRARSSTRCTAASA